VRSFAGGECIGVAEDERLNRHQDEEPGAGVQQRGVEGEHPHGQGRDGECGEGEPEPDQGARLKPAPTILALRTESRIWARAVEAKNNANGKGRRPFCTCST
jgi:hypothetical protein